MHVSITLVFKTDFPICAFRPHSSLAYYILRPSHLPWTTNHEYQRTFYPSSGHFLRLRSKYSPPTAVVTPSTSIICLGWQNIGLINHYYSVHSDPGWRSIVWYNPVHKTYMKRTLYLRGPNVWITGTRFLNRPRLAKRSHTQVCVRKSHHYTSLNIFTLLTLILLTWTIWRAPTNASKWRMGFNSAFKGLTKCLSKKTDDVTLEYLFNV